MNIKRVVIDTNVIVSALLTEGSPAKVLDLFSAKSFTLVYCAEILCEYEDVLYRPRLRIPVADADITMAAILQYGEKVRVNPSSVPMPDEKDRVFYDTAKNSGAYLITGNTRHFPREPFVLMPTMFLELISDNHPSQF